MKNSAKTNRMKRTAIRIILIGVISMLFSGYGYSKNPLACSRDSLGRIFVGKEIAQKELSRFINNPEAKPKPDYLKGRVLIKDEKTLISIVEPILFQLFGEKTIINERPYETYLFDDYWIMRGTMPALPPPVLLSNGSWRITTQSGGTFTIVVNKNTCEIIGITHGE
jgi:hypothetical protein